MRFLFFLSLALCLSYSAQAQLRGAMVVVKDSATGQRLGGIGTFFYGTNNPENQNYVTFKVPTYTGTNSGSPLSAGFPFYGNFQAGDTVYAGVIDCNGNEIYSSAIILSLATGVDSAFFEFYIGCPPTSCTYLVQDSIDYLSNPPTFYGFSWPLTDSSQIPLNSGRVYRWTLSDGSVYMGSQINGIPIDTTIPFGYCYESLEACIPFCKGDSIPVISNPVISNPNIICEAKWVLDTLNSPSPNGNLIIYDVSLVTDTVGDTVSIIDWYWDFGDSTYSNQQYPTHAYADTGWQNLCLTITAVNGADTCTSAFFDSLGIDANGNILYKGGSGTGFTIQVIDPATISLKETSEMELKLYPNPASEFIHLSWRVEADLVEIFNLNGTLISKIGVKGQNRETIDVSDLPAGIYLISITGGTSKEQVRFVKQ